MRGGAEFLFFFFKQNLSVLYSQRIITALFTHDHSLDDDPLEPTTATVSIMASAQFELSDPPRDAISAIRFAPTASRLLVASWDKNVYLYDTAQSGGQLLQTFQHRAPVLDVCFGDGDEDAYTTGLDWDVRQ